MMRLLDWIAHWVLPGDAFAQQSDDAKEVAARAQERAEAALRRHDEVMQRERAFRRRRQQRIDENTDAWKRDAP